MSWLLLAVFVALAVLVAPRLWRAQVQRQNDQAFAAQAASVGASVTTAVRRMDDLTLAARTLLANDPKLTDEGFEAGTSRWASTSASAASPGFAYAEIVREPVRRRLPAGQARLLLPADGSASPAPAWRETLNDAAVPGYDLCQISKLFVQTRDTGGSAPT